MANEMSELIKQRQMQREIKKQKSQLPYAIVIIVIALILGVILWPINHIYAINLIIGILIGIVLRYSRFCFSAAFRDPILMRSTKILRAILIAMMISTIGFAVIQSEYLKQTPVIQYDLIPGAVSSVGIHVMIGAFIFGIGMVIAVGCASGVLMRIGEGHTLQLVVLVGFIIGTLLGAKDYSYWYDHIIVNTKTIYFPEYLDFKMLVILQLIILMILYKLALWYEKRPRKDM